jgi:hypothetical protein
MRFSHRNRAFVRLYSLNALEDQMKKALARLRARTDRELGILAEQQLEQTLRLAQAGKREEAARRYQSAQRLLAVTNLPCLDRERIDDLLARVEAALHIQRPVSAVA